MDFGTGSLLGQRVGLADKVLAGFGELLDGFRNDLLGGLDLIRLGIRFCERRASSRVTRHCVFAPALTGAPRGFGRFRAGCETLNQIFEDRTRVSQFSRLFNGKPVMILNERRPRGTSWI